MIQCVGLNPVYQKTLTIENFRLNKVNRASPSIHEGSAGKGINVGRILKTLGQTSIITGFLGGHTGEFISQSLHDEGLPFDVVNTHNATRTCTTILDPINQLHTEIVEEGKPVSGVEVEQMVQIFERHLDLCPLVTISGTAPQHVPEDIYFRFIQLAHQRQIPVFVDTQKRLLLRSLDAQPRLVKINREELGLAFQEPVDTEERFQRLIQRVHQKGVEWVVISHGKEDTLVSHRDGQWVFTPPSINVVNPIGSGDAMLAGISATVLNGGEMLEAVRIGVACGSANALTLAAGSVHTEDVERLRHDVTFTRLN